MISIGICGGPSSGKTTLAKSLSNKLYLDGNNVHYISEFARDYINKCKANGDFVPGIGDQAVIFDEQLDRENAVPKEAEFVISDSPIFLPVIFTAKMTVFSSFQSRSFYLHFYEKALKELERYNHIFFVEHEKPFVSDGTRNETEHEAKQIGKQIRGFLDFHRISYTHITGDNEERVKRCLEILC